MVSTPKITKITKAQQIIDIIEPIPAEIFCKYSFVLRDSCCFLGHINEKLGNSPVADRNGFGARELIAKFLQEVHRVKLNVDGTTVNDGPTVNGYNEPGIKDRIMHMLHDMKAAGY